MGTDAGAEWPELEVFGETAGSVTDTKLQYVEDKIPGHHKECAAFADAILNNKPSPVPAEQSLNVMRILEGLYRSNETGREVEV
jgi:predicted dehydrogenase